jgi:hypothetical protein
VVLYVSIESAVFLDTLHGNHAGRHEPEIGGPVDLLRRVRVVAVTISSSSHCKKKRRRREMFPDQPESAFYEYSG